jgi:hypothetical protein
MSKRLTDTDKWKKATLKSMPAPYKLLWLYICDDCSHAGIWHVDIDVAALRIGENVTIEKAIEIFGEKVVVFDGGDKWFLPSFVEFQYGELSEKNNVHKAVLKELRKYNLTDLRPSQGSAEEAKDMDKDKDKEKDKGGMGGLVVGGIFPGEESLTWELPEIKIGSAIQFFSIAKQKKNVSEETIKGLWEVFKVKEFTGKNWYRNRDDTYRHFLSSLNFLKLEDATKLNHKDRQQQARSNLKRSGSAIFNSLDRESNDRA